MKKLSQLGVAEGTVTIHYSDTRTIKIRKFKEYETKPITDFTIDGQSVQAMVSGMLPDTEKVSTCLRQDFSVNERKKYLQRLMGILPPDLASGRVALYVCPIDGDIMCGSVGCRVNIEGNTVSWSDFAWDSVGISDDEDDFDEDDEPEKVADMTSYLFDRKEYEALLNDLLAKLQQR